MKCPACGDTNAQERLSATGSRSVGYRCGKCSRVYDVAIADLATFADRVEELKASAEWIVTQHAELAERIAELEVQLRAASETLESAERRIENSRQKTDLLRPPQ